MRDAVKIGKTWVTHEWAVLFMCGGVGALTFYMGAKIKSKVCGPAIRLWLHLSLQVSSYNQIQLCLHLATDMHLP